MKRLESEMDQMLSLGSSDLAEITITSDARAVHPNTTTAIDTLKALFYNKTAKEDSRL